VADGGEDGVDGIALCSLEIAAVEMTLGLHMADDGLDGGATSEFALDDAEHAALLAGDEDAVRVGHIVAAIALVAISALDGAAGKPFDGLDSGAQRVAVVRVARQRRGLQHELAARRAGLALADAFDLGGMEGIPLPAALALLLRADLMGACQRPREDLFQRRLAGDLAADVADDAAKA